MEYPRQEYWSGLPFPPPGNRPDPGVEPISLTSPVLTVGFFITHLNVNPFWVASESEHLQITDLLPGARTG